jgi:hypothetical protein
MLTRALGIAAGAAVISVMTPVPALAQVAVSGGVDFPTLYYFRGVRQEVDPALTMWPWVDAGVPIMAEGDGAIQSANLNIGSWNSIHSGSNNDAFDGAFYESDFYATLGLGFSGWSLATTYTAYMYPSPDFDAIHEVMFRATASHMLAPYGLFAQEFAEDDPGTYLELGIGPSFALSDEEGGPTLAVPVKAGFDLNDYYGGDSGFSFFSAGGTVTYPLTTGDWGSASLRGGLEVLALSETLEAFNVDDELDTSATGFVAFGGIAFSF